MKKRILSLALTFILALSLSVSAGAANVEVDNSLDNNAEIEMVKALYAHKKDGYILSSDGSNITNAFLAEHQDDYNTENFAAIADDFKEKELFAIYPSQGQDEDIMPLINVNFTTKASFRGEYTYNKKLYSFSVDTVIRGLLNDSTGYFTHLYPVEYTNFSYGSSAITTISLETGLPRLSRDVANVNVTATLNTYGTKNTTKWGVTVYANGAVKYSILP